MSPDGTGPPPVRGDEVRTGGDGGGSGASVEVVVGSSSATWTGDTGPNDATTRTDG